MKEGLFRPPVQVRALALVKRNLPLGTPEGRYVLRIIETRAKAAESRQVQKQRCSIDPTRPRKVSLKSIRDRLDHEFSRFIRARDTQVQEDGVRRGHCITCGSYHTFAEFDCGHWIPRKHLATRWHELNAAAQDSGCNRWQHGKPVEFEAKLRALHGNAAVDKLLFLKKFGKPPSRVEMERLIAKYKSAADAMGVPP